MDFCSAAKLLNFLETLHIKLIIHYYYDLMTPVFFLQVNNQKNMEMEINYTHIYYIQIIDK